MFFVMSFQVSPPSFDGSRFVSGWQRFGLEGSRDSYDSAVALDRQSWIAKPIVLDAFKTTKIDKIPLKADADR